MDVNAISTLIANLGFPIVCVIAMFYMWNKERESHAEETSKWIDAFNKNTEALNDLKDLVKSIKGE